jgi:hypothetical protein
MKTMTDIRLCELCYNILWEKGKAYSDIWRIAAKVYCIGVWPIFPDPDEKQQEIIEFLEKEKYILTTEIHNELCIKPLGYIFLGQCRHGFCINIREHKPLFGVD